MVCAWSGKLARPDNGKSSFAGTFSNKGLVALAHSDFLFVRSACINQHWNLDYWLLRAKRTKVTGQVPPLTHTTRPPVTRLGSCLREDN